MNDILNVVGEPVYYEITTHDGIKWVGENRNTLPGHTSVGLYAESQLQAAYRKGMEERDAKWFSLVMNAAAEIEDAANCLRDPDAKRTAISAAKHYRREANRALPIEGEQSE